VFLGSRLLATITPDGARELVQYHHPDRLGTRLIMHAADTAVAKQQPFSFGVEAGSVSAGGHTRRFTSYDRSAATGLDYAVNRYYDPQQGRFMQADPLEIEGASLMSQQSLNLYADVRNDPVNSIDPLGLRFRQVPLTGCSTEGDSGVWSCTTIYVSEWVPDPEPRAVPRDKEIKPYPERGGGRGGASPVGLGYLHPGSSIPYQQLDQLVRALQNALSFLGRNVGKGLQVNSGGLGCGFICTGMEGSVGFYLTPASPTDLFFGEMYLFSSVGGAFMVTPGPNGPEAAMGLAAGGGLDFRAFITESVTAGDHGGWSRNVGAALGPLSVQGGMSPNGQRSLSIGLGVGAGAGVWSWNEYTWVSGPLRR
jgi:RHS repeat-associated protein